MPRTGPYYIETVSPRLLTNSRKLTKDASGNWYLVFHDVLETGVSNIYLSKSTDGGETWSKTAITSDATYSQENPSIAIDSNDYIHIVWAGKSATSPSYRQIRYRKYTGSWQAIEELTSHEHFNQLAPAVAIDNNDYIHVVWYGSHYYEDEDHNDRPRIHYRHHTGSWQAQKFVDNPDDDNYGSQEYPIIAIDTQNNIHVAWIGYVTPTGWTPPEERWLQCQYNLRLAASATFGDYRQVSPAAFDNCWYCDMAIDSDDRAYIVYSQRDPAEPTNSPLYFRRKQLAGNLSNPEDISFIPYLVFRITHKNPSISYDIGNSEANLAFTTSYQNYGVIHKYYDSYWHGGRSITTAQFSHNPVLSNAMYPTFCRPDGIEMVYCERSIYTGGYYTYKLYFLTDDSSPTSLSTKKKTFTTDGIVKAEGVAETFTTDCVVAERKTAAFTTDCHVVSRNMGEFTTDCVVSIHTVEFTTDCHVASYGNALTFTTDCVVAQVVENSIGSNGAIRDYTTLPAWDAGEARNLVTAYEIEHAICYDDGADIGGGVSLTDGSWTTSDSFYIKIYAAASDKHKGYDSSGARIAQNPGGDTISVQIPNVWIEGLEIESSALNYGVRVNQWQVIYAGWLKFGKNLFVGTGYGIGSTSTASGGEDDIYIWNNSFQGVNVAYYGIHIRQYHSWWLYSNSISNGRGIWIENANSNVIVKNTAVLYNSTSGFNFNPKSGFHADSCRNASTQSAASAYGAPGSNSVHDALSTDEYYRADVKHVLRIFATGDLYQAGADLSTDADFPFSDDILDNDRGSTWDIGAFKQEDPTDNTVSVGTAGAPTRDYSTLTAWEAQETNVAGENINEIVECYNDGVMSDNVTINNWVGCPVTQIKITTPAAERHSGVRGTGFRLTGAAGTHTIILNVPYVWVEGLSLSNANASNQAYRVDVSAAEIGWYKFSHNVVYDCYGVLFNDAPSGSVAYVWNNFIVNCSGLYNVESLLVGYFYGNSVHGCALGIRTTNNQLVVAKNNVSMNNSSDRDFYQTAYFHSASDYNCSTADSSSIYKAPGGNSLHSKVDTDNYTNTGAGTEDLHIVDTGADIFDTAVDLSGDSNLAYEDDIDSDYRARWDIGADFYEVGAPIVTSVTPDTGSYVGGTTVVIAGSNFGSTEGTITFGGTAVTVVASWANTSITCDTPAHAVGLVDVAVTSGDTGLIGQKDDAYTYHEPTITLIDPDSGTVDGGTTVTITGTHFEADNGVVTFDDIEAEITSWSDTAIVCVTPEHAAGVVDVKVVTYILSEVTEVDGYTYVCLTPTITLIDPDHGRTSGGTLVEITGTNFGINPNAVYFDSDEIELLIWEDTAIFILTPAHEKGFVDVTVKNICLQSVTEEDGYEYQLVVIGNVHIFMMMMRNN